HPVAGDVPALAENGFDDEGRGFGGGGEGGKHVVEFAQGEGGGFFLAPAVAVGGGEGGDVHTGHERAETGGEPGAGGGHGRGGHGAAVESAVEDDHIGPPGGLAGQPQRRFDRLTARVGVEHRIQSGGQYRAEAFGELEQRPVHHGRVLAVDQFRDLGLCRRHHVRMAVAGAGDTDTGREIEVSATVGVV